MKMKILLISLFIVTFLNQITSGYHLCRQKKCNVSTEMHTKLDDCSSSIVATLIKIRGTKLREGNKYGILDVNLTVPSNCDIEELKITLFVAERIKKEEQCDYAPDIFDDKFLDDGIYHSYQSICNSFSMNCTIDEMQQHYILCDDNIEIQFWHVFTGCYQIEVEPKSTSSKGFVPISTGAFWVESPYVKQYDNYTVDLTFNPNPISNVQSLFLTLNFTLIGYLEITFKSLSNSTASPVYYNLCQDGLSDIEEGVLPPDTICKYYNSSNQVICELPEVPFSNVSVISEVKNSQCDAQSIWAYGNYSVTRSRGCAYVATAVNDEYYTPSKPTLDSPDKNTLPLFIIIYVATAALVAAALVSGIVVFRNYLRRPREGRTRSIFLVYARDCKEIMSIIRSFSMIFRNAGVEVFDIYNADYFPQLTLNPSIWIQTKLQQADVVVYVSTDCGQVLFDYNSKLQDLVLLAKENIYREQEWLDHLFMYAYNVASSSQEKFYVVRFNDLPVSIRTRSSENSRRGHFFKIPEKFNRFCKALNIRNWEEIIVSKNIHYKQMEYFTKMAVCFLEKNPDYLYNSLLQLDDQPAKRTHT